VTVYALAAGLAYLLVILGLVNVLAGETATGAGLLAAGCAVAASTRLRR
jgi:hypothetical protein